MNQTSPELKNNPIFLNYRLINLLDVIIVKRITRIDSITETVQFRVKREKVKGFDLDDPKLIFNLILMLWQQNQ
jgi:hypothetical protein